MAHRAALEHGGCTVAVLGAGIDVIYPPEHAQLANEISQKGAPSVSIRWECGQTAGIFRAGTACSVASVWVPW